MSYFEDVEAIDRYITSQPVNTSAAARIKDEWIAWHDNVSTWLGVSREDYDHARNLRNQFFLANAITPDQKAAAENTIKTGVTTEEMAGGTDRRLTTGMYGEPLISSATKTKLVIGAVAVGGGYLALQILKSMPGVSLALDSARKLVRG